MTTHDLTNLGLDASQQACLRAALAQAYRAGRAVGRAEMRRGFLSDTGADAEPGMPWLSDEERAGLVAEMGT